MTISVRTLVVSVISVFALLTLIGSLVTASWYKEEAFRAKLKVSSRFIEVSSRDSIVHLSDLGGKLGQELSNDRTLRKLHSRVLKGKSATQRIVEQAKRVV
ncbi:hypothetical protein [Vibrio hepatarius]|uniref:hypothetical protein n=1 Tax=Vibrio hepatarius TaxID=171383 RepID=UPI001C08F90A|nr:hypothetical protein [Vibrio hepatarius]MBU2897048.1 hypothetical protein [Vibrio hepatarius]